MFTEAYAMAVYVKIANIIIDTFSSLHEKRFNIWYNKLTPPKLFVICYWLFVIGYAISQIFEWPSEIRLAFHYHAPVEYIPDSTPVK